MDAPDIWYKPGEEKEHADARYLQGCIRDKQASHIMDMVREMDAIVALLGLDESFDKPTDAIRKLMK